MDAVRATPIDPWPPPSGRGGCSVRLCSRLSGGEDMRRARRPHITVARRRAGAVVTLIGAGAVASFLFASDARATVSFGPLSEYSAADTQAHASGTNGVALGDFDAD